MRYIDAELLMQKLSRMIDFCEKHKVSGLNALFQVGDAIMDCPTADVVPKSEYDAVVNAVDNSTKEFLKLHDAFQEQKVEIEALRGAANSYKMHYENLAKEIFEEIETCLYRPFDNIPDDVHYQIREQDYDELKKKCSLKGAKTKTVKKFVAPDMGVQLTIDDIGE